MEENNRTYVTEMFAEDHFTASPGLRFMGIAIPQSVIVLLLSAVILSVYLGMNYMFYPGYPVITAYAEKSDVFEEHYPPFRMNEWINYSAVSQIIIGNRYQDENLPEQYSIGYPVLAAPLVKLFGDRGLYYINAFILWASALVVFSLLARIVAFPVATAFTAVFAFATPNLFFAASAYSEPTAQMLLVLSVFLFLKGILYSGNHRNRYYLFSGITSGLLVSVQPFLVFSVILFAVIIATAKSKHMFLKKDLAALAGGYGLALLILLIANKIVLGKMFVNFFSCYSSLYTIDTPPSRNVMVNLWKLLFDSPHGLVFIMPAVMIVPMGIINMWRKKIYYLSVISGVVIMFSFIAAAMSSCPISDETVGYPQLLPIIPFLVIPLAVMWEERSGEKIWLGITLVLTVYMCSFGWWTGTAREEGFFIGILHDSDARAILLARKSQLEKPVFTSSTALNEQFFEALRSHDMKRWLQTLDTASIGYINGFERIIYLEILRRFESGAGTVDEYIEFTDPDNGIRLTVPDIEDYDSYELRDGMD